MENEYKINKKDALHDAILLCAAKRKNWKSLRSACSNICGLQEARGDEYVHNTKPMVDWINAIDTFSNYFDYLGGGI